MKITEHFQEDEFRCKCGCGDVKLDKQLAYGLETLRRILKKPIHINSAYRCEEHNQSVGGSVNSQHLVGTAADIHVEGVAPDEIHKHACNIFDGVGLYDSFVHVDVRGTKARWGRLPHISSNDILPDIPTDKEIEDKLKAIEGTSER